MKEIKSKSSVDAAVVIPGSKSVTHRALITAGLAQGESLLKEFLACEDTLYTASALRELGIQISIKGTNATVSGLGGDFASTPAKKEIYVGNSGTSYRLLLSIVALARGEYTLTGTPRMHTRPVGDLVKALNSLGVEASYTQQEGFPPVSINAKGITGGLVKIPGEQSSQFVSSLLLAGPYAESDIEIEVTGNLVSRPYIDVTLDVMKSFGIPVRRDGYRHFRIKAGERYCPAQVKIDGDVSSASYFWGAAAVTGGTVVTENIHPHTTRQGDIALLDIMEEMGCRIERETERVIVHGGRLSGIDVDMGSVPDMVPTLAALALFAEGRTTIRNVPHLRHKESDRLGDTALELRRLGSRVEERDDGLVIHGGASLSGATTDPHDDHRLAMSLAIVGLKVPGIKIIDEDCVEKSFPSFWELWDSL